VVTNIWAPDLIQTAEIVLAPASKLTISPELEARSVPAASQASTDAGAPSTRMEVNATAKQIVANATIGMSRAMCCHFGL
jgi:hypothetical protein